MLNITNERLSEKPAAFPAEIENKGVEIFYFKDSLYQQYEGRIIKPAAAQVFFQRISKNLDKVESLAYKGAHGAGITQW